MVRTLACPNSRMAVGGTVSYMRSVSRVVSLVPSITEALASVRREAVVGATDWCTHPADLDDTLEQRVRGTKNPNLDTIRALRPDVVIANQEENRELDVRRLRESGVEVHVTRIETVPEAVEAFEELFDDVLGWERPDWLAEVRDQWCGPLRRSRGRWRSPSGATRGWWSEPTRSPVTWHGD